MADPAVPSSITPASVTQTGSAAGPGPTRYAEIRALYYQLTSKQPYGEKFDAELKEALKDGILDRHELRHLFKLSHFTKEAFQAFTGGQEQLGSEEAQNSDLVLDELKKYMDHYVKFQEKTQIPFSYFASATRVTVISKEDCGKVIKNMSAQKVTQMVAGHLPRIREILAYLDNNDATLKDATEKTLQEKIKELQDEGGDKLDWLGFMLFYDLHKNIALNDKMVLRADLQDPVVAKKFADAIFLPYLTDGKAVARANVREIGDFSKRIDALREFVGWGKGGTEFDPVFSDVDPSSPSFTSILTDFEARPKAERDEDKAFRQDLRTRLQNAGGETAVPDAVALQAEDASTTRPSPVLEQTVPLDSHALQVRQQALGPSRRLPMP